VTGLRSPLARARGLGSAKEGVQHWWVQRLTALALVPLSLWFVASMVSLTGADYDSVSAWIMHTHNAVFLILLVGVGFHHAQLGLQVVIEDYVHTEWRKLGLVLAVKFGAFLVAAGTIYAILRLGIVGGPG
jgi:succinate dehydrogenase / fumarate reductase, membrane anchor subunit